MAVGLFGRLGGRGQSSKDAASKDAAQSEFEVKLSDEEWRKRLTPEQYRVLREHGTERAGTSPLDKNYDPGVYHCAGCGQPLFDASTKFNSRTGWPSFYEPLENAVETQSDRGFFMYQKRRSITVRIPFIRWGQAWMAYAIARLLEARTR